MIESTPLIGSATRYEIVARQYWLKVPRTGRRYDHEYHHGLAELVRAVHVGRGWGERETAAIYWWPQSGPCLPSAVFPIEMKDLDRRIDPWAAFTQAEGLDDHGVRYVECPPLSFTVSHDAVDEQAMRRVPRRQDQDQLP